ncbi:anti-repressor SinI family protein [Neobacillus niacini]|nr:anti-repressor SinI family protein [Neobacillus niacini]MCM3767719.1 anti-repressor SinI family protein [Neobacillus niacini]
MSVKTTVKEELDQDWLELMLEARDLGISIDEIRDFLQQS